MPQAQEEEAGESAQTVRNGGVEMHDLSRLCCIKSKGAPQPHKRPDFWVYCGIDGRVFNSFFSFFLRLFY